MDAKKRIIDLTLGEFLDAIGERMEVSAQKPEKPKSAKRYVYGLKVGALLIIDADLALKLAADNKKK